jgi:hypothetical protein
VEAGQNSSLGEQKQKMASKRQFCHLYQLIVSVERIFARELEIIVRPRKKRLSDIRSPRRAWALGDLLVNVSALWLPVMEPDLFKAARERGHLFAPGTRNLACSNSIAFPLFGWIVFNHMDTLLSKRRILIIHLSPDRGKKINLIGSRFIKSLVILET